MHFHVYADGNPLELHVGEAFDRNDEFGLYRHRASEDKEHVVILADPLLRLDETDSQDQLPRLIELGRCITDLDRQENLAARGYSVYVQHDEESGGLVFHVVAERTEAPT